MGKLRDSIRARRQKIEAVLGEAAICDRCGATLATYGDVCAADLSEWCPGFEAIERAESGRAAMQEDKWPCRSLKPPPSSKPSEQSHERRRSGHVRRALLRPPRRVDR